MLKRKRSMLKRSMLKRKRSTLSSRARCVGSQRFVHSACLRRWQRVASGGSHDAVRHATFCAVCTAPFSVLPPVPHLQPGCLLVAAPSVAGEFARAVVLICRADADEVEGLLLNRSSDEAEAARVVAEAEALLAEAQAFVTPSRRAPSPVQWPSANVGAAAAHRRARRATSATSRPK